MRACQFLFLSCILVSPLNAQWRFSLAAGPAATAGHSIDTSDPERAAILPDRPVTWTIGVALQRGAWRVGLEGHRLDSDLAVRGTTTSIVTRDLLTAYGGGIELARRIWRSEHGPALWGGLGAVWERWTVDGAGDQPRSRALGRGALQLDVPLARHWSGLVRGELLAGRSLFTDDELPEGYRTRGSRRMGLLLGITLADTRR